MSKERLSSRQVTTLKQLAICCSQGAPAMLTRDQREAMQPLWRRGLVEMWIRCVPDEGMQRTAFFRPTKPGWALINAILGSAREEIAA